MVTVAAFDTFFTAVFTTYYAVTTVVGTALTFTAH